MHSYSTRRSRNLDPSPLLSTAKVVANCLPNILTSIAQDIQKFEANDTKNNATPSALPLLIQERDTGIMEIGQFLTNVWFILRDEEDKEEEITMHVEQAYQNWLQTQPIPEESQHYSMGEKCTDVLVTAKFLSSSLGKSKYSDAKFFMQSLAKSERFMVCAMQHRKMKDALDYLSKAPSRAIAAAIASQSSDSASSASVVLLGQSSNTRVTRASSKKHQTQNACVAIANNASSGKTLTWIPKHKTTQCGPPKSLYQLPIASMPPAARLPNAVRPANGLRGKTLTRIPKRKTVVPPKSLYRLSTARLPVTLPPSFTFTSGLSRQETQEKAIQEKAIKPRCITLDNVAPQAIYFQCEINPRECQKVTTLYLPPKNCQDQENQNTELGSISELLDQLGYVGQPDHLGRRCVDSSAAIDSPTLGRLSYQQPYKSHRKHLHECIRRHHNLVPNDVVDQSLLPPFFRDRRFYGDPTQVDLTVSMTENQRKAQSRMRMKKLQDRKDLLLRSFLWSEQACRLVFGERYVQLIPRKYYRSVMESPAPTKEELYNMERLP